MDGAKNMMTVCFALELKKVIRRPGFLAVWTGLLVLAGFFVWQQVGGTPQKRQEALCYEAISRWVSEKDPETVLQAMETVEENYRKRSWGWKPLEGEEKEENEENIEPDLCKELEMLLPENEELALRLIGDIHEELQSVSHIQDNRKRVLDEAKRAQSVSFFQKDINPVEKEAFLKMESDYEAAPAVAMTPFQGERGIRAFLENPFVDFLILVLCQIIVWLMDGEGNAGSTESMIRATKKGGWSLLAIRILATFVFAMLVALSFMTAAAVVVRLFYSWGDLSRPVQMIAGYSGCLYSLRVWQLLLLCFFWKVTSFFFLSCLTLAIGRCSSSVFAGSLVSIALWAIGCYLSQYTASTSYLREAGYLNLYALSHAENWISVYHNVSFAGIWWNYWQIALFAAGIEVLLLLVLFTASFPLGRLTGARKGRPAGTSRVHFGGLKTAECYKSFVVLRYGLWFLLIGALHWYIVLSQPVLLDQQEMAYRLYMNRWERELHGPDPVLEQEMETEEMVLIEVLQGTSTVYTQQAAGYLQTGLARVEERYEDACRSIADGGDNVYFFYDGAYKRLVGDRERSLFCGGMGLLLIFLAVAGSLLFEYRTGMRRMIRSTGKGEKEYVKDKLFLTALFACCVYIISYGPDLWMTGTLSQWKGILFSVHSVEWLSDNPLNISLLAFLILQQFGNLLKIFAAGVCVTLATAFADSFQ